MEKTTSDKILQEIVLYERGVDTSASFHTTSTNSFPQIKTEPAFAIDSKRKFSKQRRQQNRGGVDKQKNKTNHCRNCGFTPWSPTHECPAKGQECRLCKRKGHFSKYCPYAKEAVKSIEEDLRSLTSNAGSEHRDEQGPSSSNNQLDITKAQVGFISQRDDDSEVEILSIEDAEVDEIIKIIDDNDDV